MSRNGNGDGQQSVRVSQLQREETGAVSGIIMYRIKCKGLRYLGHLTRMNEDSWPIIIGHCQSGKRCERLGDHGIVKDESEEF